MKFYDHFPEYRDGAVQSDILSVKRGPNTTEFILILKQVPYFREHPTLITSLSSLEMIFTGYLDGTASRQAAEAELNIALADDEARSFFCSRLPELNNQSIVSHLELVLFLDNSADMPHLREYKPLSEDVNADLLEPSESY